MGSTLRLGVFLSLCAVALILGFARAENEGGAAEGPKTVFVVTVSEMIDLGLAPFVERAVEQAKGRKADTIVFEIDTFGGRMDSMLVICEAIDRAECPTVAYCRHKAMSAGALVALACDKIYLRPGTTIGAATPVIQTSEGMEKASEKLVSAARGWFRTWAQRKKHPVSLAEAMVDEDIEVKEVQIGGKKLYLTPAEIKVEEGKRQGLEAEVKIIRTVCEKGKLLTLTSLEAVQYGLAEAEVESRELLLEALGLSGAKIVSMEINWSEELVRWLTHPIVSGLLLTVGFIGLFTELKMPGFGAPGIIAIACFALFFWSRHLVHLANYPEMILFVIGLALIGIEMFAIPGFGVVGILGILCLFGSLFLAFMPGIRIPQAPWEWNRAMEGATSIAVSLLAFMVVAAVMVKFLPQTPFLNRLILSASEKSEEGFHVEPGRKQVLKVGETGVALSTLRPAGRARIGDRTVDVVAQGDFIEKGQNVRVLEVSGNRIVVKRV
jgi:membrane-bound serine protease (ClpP class)